MFFKRFWAFVGPKVQEEVLSALNGGPIPAGWNETIIVLIPKTKNPHRLKDLRPISLCNVVYKLISKTLANRLRVVLPEIISQSQSAFVPGRLITDNILLAYELTHHMHLKKGGREGIAAIKLDMSKAYDRVEWNFLENIMRKLGFGEQWIRLIMTCVSTVSYRIKVNKDYTDIIHPRRGLRQGCPLSPYLFILCAEGLSVLFRAADADGSLKGVKISPTAPSINHLFFAYDSLIFMKADEANARRLKHILAVYEGASGQMINKDKSSVLFSKGTGDRTRRKVLNILGINAEARNEKYLGLPVYLGRSKSKAFEYLKEKIWRKIQGWKEKFLSKAGKEILIKAVAQAIPTYAMSCFNLTKNFCDQISTMVCRYWWDNQDESRHHWLSWECLTRSKKAGVWVSGIFTSSIWPCLQDRDGDCSIIRTP